MATEKTEMANYFTKMRKVCRLTGYFLNERLTRPEKVILWIVPLLLYVYTSVVLIRDWNSEIGEFVYTSALVLVVPRITIMRLKRTKLAQVLMMMERLGSFTLGYSKELDASLQRSLNIVGAIFYPLGGCFTTLLLIQWLISIRNGLPFDTMPQWAMDYNFPICLVFQSVVFITCVQDYVMSEAIKLSILLQLRSHFKQFKLRIRDILVNAKKENGDEANGDLPWEILRKQLKKLNSHHNYLIRISKGVEDVYNKSVLVIFIFTSCLNCRFLLRMTKLPQWDVEFYKLGIYIMYISMLFFGDCYFSELVTTESEGLSYAFYEIDFIGTDLRFQKALMMFMAKVQRTVIFTIGKFGVLSVVAIVTITKATYSYFTLLRSLKND